MFGDFGVLGSSLDVFGARGGPGTDLVELIRNAPFFLAPFWSHVWNKAVMCLRRFCRCFCWMVCLWILNGFGITCERFFDNIFVFFGKREYVKTSTACARELDFQGLERLGSVKFCDFWGVGFGMAPGMDFE